MRMFLGALAAAWIGAAQAAPTESLTLPEIGALLDEAGFSAELVEIPGSGVSGAVGQVGDVSFSLRALDCSGAPRACATLLLYAQFDLGRPVSASDYQAVNRFNDGQVFGRAYVDADDQRVGVDYTIEMRGGVSRDHIGRNLVRWKSVVERFVASFRSRPGV